MKKRVILLGLALLIVLTATACRKNRISYTDMIKRENKEIRAFMDKQGFRVIKDFPKDLKMNANEFVELKNEVGEGIGVWINILSPGAKEDMAENGKTPILARFSYTAIGDRMKGGLKKFSNIGPTVTNISGVTFIYLLPDNADYRGNIPPAPNSSSGEVEMQSFACNAMMLALKHVPLGSTIQMITSFREGPSFTFQNTSAFENQNDAGVALYYDQLKFTRKL